MATLNLRRFAEPAALRALRPDLLRDLLARFSGYFGGRLFDVDAEDLDHEALAGILVTPDRHTPPELLDALYLVCEMDGPEEMEALLAANAARPERERVDFGPTKDLTPADVALLVWLRAPQLLEEKHAEAWVTDRKSFQYYCALHAPRREFTMPTRATLQALELDLGEWFESKLKGAVVRVFAYPRPDGVWFLVRHGGPFSRQGTLNDDKSGSVFFRPEVHDVLVYNPVLGEIRINAGTKGEKDLYRRAFGKHLFGSEDHFPEATAKYTLEPLKAGPDSIVCSDVEGLEWVQLTEVTYSWGAETEVRRASDLFAVWKEREKEIPPKARIVAARFRMKFRANKTPRSVSVRVANVAKFTRDEDSALVEMWLERRGFSVPREADADDEDHAKALEVS